MSTIDTLKLKIDSLKNAVINNSITPASLGYILDGLLAEIKPISKLDDVVDNLTTLSTALQNYKTSDISDVAVMSNDSGRTSLFFFSDTQNRKAWDADPESNSHLVLRQVDFKSFTADWHGTHDEYDALGAWDAGRWYFVEGDGNLLAVYRGTQLVSAEPNCIGQFSDDSTPDDWYWWPNGVKTPLPVDPATKRFAFFYPNVLPWDKSSELFAGGAQGKFDNYKLIRLESLPKMGRFYGALRNLWALEVYPVIDCGNLIEMYKRRTIEYMILNSNPPKAVYFKNTERVMEVEMVINVAGEKNPYNVYGFDATSLITMKAWPFGVGVMRLEIKNLGKAEGLTNADLRSYYWGNDDMAVGSRQSVVDTLLNWSYDRAAAGYAPCTLQISEYTDSVLTSEEKAAIAAKGYTIAITPP